MEPLKQLNGKITELPRGGYLIDTIAGYIQIGSPPETIKDTMLLPKGVPQIFVLTSELFSKEKGISIAELEFPIYYNFFLKQRKTIIVCTEEQAKRLRKSLKEAIFGPDKLNIKDDFLPLENTYIPDIEAEMRFFRGNITLSKMMKFGVFKNGGYRIDNNVVIKKLPSGDFEIIENNKKIRVSGKIDYTPEYKIGQRLKEPFVPPLFGVTCLGPSHGFDPYENTSGYIIWLNHNGIMIDPPVNSTEWLEKSNVNPKFIDSIILTHTHADHDAGTFQKIIEEGRITIYTTKTILESFLKKYSALTNLSVSYLRQLFNFYPVKINNPVFIHGGKFRMFYSLHSIPTMGFRIEFQGKTFVYSSDHNNDPTLHKKLYEMGIISKERYKELRNFPWDSDVIYHEAGIPPLHTPVKFLNSLPEKIQKKIVVYHIAKKDFPEKTSLTLAKFGIENTLYFKINRPHFENIYKILDVLRSMDIFNELGVEKTQEFITIVQEEKFKKGDKIIEKGKKGYKFFIIYSGNVSVKTKNSESKKIYGTYDYFGEVALITDADRSADVVAETNVVAYSIEKEKFLSFISETKFEKMLLRLARTRSAETWELLSTSPYFRYCTPWQKTWIESMLIPDVIKANTRIIKEGEKLNNIYIIRKGNVEVRKKNKLIATLKNKDFIGEIDKIYKNQLSSYTFINKEEISVFRIVKDDIVNFLRKNPGLLLKFMYNFK